MVIVDKIRDEKLQYDINRLAATISALSSGKIVMNILQVKKILLSNQKQQNKLSLVNLLQEKLLKTKTIEGQEEKQREALENRVKKNFQTLMKNQLL